MHKCYIYKNANDISLEFPSSLTYILENNYTTNYNCAICKPKFTKTHCSIKMNWLKIDSIIELIC